MEELSIEEKAKAYDEAIKKVDDIRKGNSKTPFVYNQGLFEYLFPLKDSEDERIRRNIIAALKGEGYYDCDLTNECIAWLEKQGDHAKFRNGIQIGDRVTRSEFGLVNLSQLKRVAKPADKQGDRLEKQKEDKINVEALLTADKLASAEMTGRLKERKDILENPHKYGLQKQGEQKPAWSEEDEDKLVSIEDSFSDYLDYVQEDSSLTKYQKKSTKEVVFEHMNWLKSIKQRHTWKPSDEQMDALNDVISSRDIKYDVLSELWKDLKKLKGE